MQLFVMNFIFNLKDFQSHTYKIHISEENIFRILSLGQFY